MIESLLECDIYVTFKGRWKGKPVVIKLFTAESDLNNEYNVLHYLQKVSIHPEWFPESYFVHLPGSGVFRALGQQWKGHFAIVYQYIEGTTVNIDKLTSDEKAKLRIEVKEQLDEMHRVFLIHGDVRPPNIIRTPDRFQLIDYGRTCSVDGFLFPPLEFMIKDGFMPTQENDLASLEDLTNES